MIKRKTVKDSTSDLEGTRFYRSTQSENARVDPLKSA